MSIPGDLGKITTVRKNGSEPFTDGTKSLDFDILNFWQWSSSDLVSNATRGVLAEFIVAQALGIRTDVRDEWDAFDLVMPKTPDGIKIEVKSAAYIQSWNQKNWSSISFRASRTIGWNSSTNEYGKESIRQSNVYVFALLAHKHKPTVNPMDVSQWEFFVVPTSVLNSKAPNQKSFALSSIIKLAKSGTSVRYSELRDAVLNAAAS